MLPAVGKRTFTPLILLLIGVAAFVLGAYAISRAGLLSGVLPDTACTEFSTQRSTVSMEGLQVHVAPDALQGRFGIKLDSSAISADALQKLPAGLLPQSGFYLLRTCSVLPRQLALAVDIPTNVSDMSALDLYAWDNGSWRWLGGQVDANTHKIVAEVSKPPAQLALMQVAPVQPVVGAEMPRRDANTGGPTIAIPDGLIKEVLPTGLYLGDQGELAGDRTQVQPRQADARSFPVVRNWSSDGSLNRTLVRKMLTNEAIRRAHASHLVQFVQNGNYDGIAIDYRGMEPELRQAFTEFIHGLTDVMHSMGKQVIVVVPAPAINTATDAATSPQWDEGAYDLRAISALADQVHIDLCYAPTVLAGGQLHDLMQWTVGRINRQKLHIVLPTLSMRQGDQAELLNLDEAMNSFSLVGDVPANTSLTPGATLQLRLKVDGTNDVTFDPATQTYYYTVAGLNGSQVTTWLGTSASLRYRLQVIEPFHIRGVIVRGLMLSGNDAGIPNVLGDFEAQRLTQTVSPAALQVSVQLNTASATRIPNEVAVNNTTVDVKLPDEPGDYEIVTMVNGVKVVNTTPHTVQVAAAPSAAPSAPTSP